MTLLERIADLKRRAQDQLNRQVGLDEAGRLQPLLTEAKTFAQGLGTEVTQRHLLRDQGLQLPAGLAGTEGDAALKTLERLRNRFSQNRRAESLNRGQDWSRFKESTEAARSQAASTLDKTWRDFVTGAYSGAKPTDLKRGLAPTEGNQQRLERYLSAYNDLAALSRRRPTGRGDFDRVQELARLLRELHEGFDFSVPDAVKRFLDAMAAGGADLDLLTDEVRNWLQQQGSTARYQIVAKRIVP